MASNVRTTVMLALSAALLAACAGRGPIEGSRVACALVGATIGGVSAGVVANHNYQRDEDTEVAGWAAGGALLGGTVGTLLCGREPLPPRAALNATPPNGDAPLRVDLTGTGTDEDGKVVTYEWDFGDGTRGTGPRATHVYEKPGRYPVRLTVTDDDGLTGSASGLVDATAQVSAQPARRPSRIVLQGVTFAFDSAAIRPEDEPVLDVAAEQLRSEAGMRVQIVGHTDDRGTEEYNQALSERRARSVAEYLGGKGIPSERFEISGRGESEPVTSNDTADGRAQNRRVELNVLQ